MGSEAGERQLQPISADDDATRAPFRSRVRPFCAAKRCRRDAGVVRGAGEDHKRRGELRLLSAAALRRLPPPAALPDLCCRLALAAPAHCLHRPSSRACTLHPASVQAAPECSSPQADPLPAAHLFCCSAGASSGTYTQLRRRSEGEGAKQGESKEEGCRGMPSKGGRRAVRVLPKKSVQRGQARQRWRRSTPPAPGRHPHPRPSPPQTLPLRRCLQTPRGWPPLLPAGRHGREGATWRRAGW